MTISTYIFYCRGSIFNSSKLPVPWKPCGLYRGGDLCRSHRAADGRYVSFWRYVGLDMWVFSGIILFMIFEYGSIIKLDLICWSPQIMWIMWILSQKQVCVRGDKIFTEKLFCAISPILSHSAKEHIFALFLQWRKNHLANTYC